MRNSNKVDWREVAKNNLQWTLDRMIQGDYSIDELRICRGMWDWHIRFEKDKELRILAEQCESVYQGNSTVNKFHLLFQFDPRVSDPKVEEFTDFLLETGDAEEIIRFFEEAMSFVRSDKKLSSGPLRTIAINLGKEAQEKEGIRRYLANFSKGSDCLHFEFASYMLSGWLFTLRENNDVAKITEVLEEFLQSCPNPESKRYLLRILYSRPHPLLAGLLTKSDLCFLEQIFDELYTDSSFCWQFFGMIGTTFSVDWELFTDAVGRAWENVEIQDSTSCFENLVESIGFRLLFHDDFPVDFEKRHFEWIMQQLVFVPDIDSISGNVSWRLGHIAETFDLSLPVEWLLGFIEARIKKASHLEGVKYYLAFMHFELDSIIETIDSSSLTEPALDAAVERLLAYNSREDLLGYVLPQLLSQIDPLGLIVPGKIAESIERLKTPKKWDVQLLARYAGHYARNSEAWRLIATSACTKAEATLNKNETSEVYYSLLNSKPVVLQSKLGEFHSHWEANVALAQRELDEETDDKLCSFRSWMLERAQAEYERERAMFEEQQGE